MSIALADNYLYQGRKPLDDRKQFQSLSVMASYTYVPEGFITHCLQTGKYYQFSSSNPHDEQTGMWREVEDIIPVVEDLDTLDKDVDNLAVYKDTFYGLEEFEDETKYVPYLKGNILIECEELPDEDILPKVYELTKHFETYKPGRYVWNFDKEEWVEFGKEEDYPTHGYYTALKKLTDYAYEVNYEDLNYPYAYKKFGESIVPTGCSSVRKGNLYGRNLDWTYDEGAEFIIHTPKAGGRYATVGTCGQISKLTNEFVQSGKYALEYVMLPFYCVDGINEKGVFINVNVVPVDTTNTEEFIGPADDSEPMVEICANMIPRYVLDYCATAQEAVETIRDHMKVYFSKKLRQMGYEPHFMIGDAEHTFIVEFVNNAVSILCCDEDATSNVAGRPYMTNFHVTDVVFNDTGKPLMTPDDDSQPTVVNNMETLGAGLERYNLIAEQYDGDTDIADIMKELRYSKAYLATTSPMWHTEFVGSDDTTVDSAAADFAGVEARAQTRFQNRSRNPEEPDKYGTWQTTHSIVYDIGAKTAIVHFQEDFDVDYTVALEMAEGSGAIFVDNLSDIENPKENMLYVLTKDELQNVEVLTQVAGLSDMVTGETYVWDSSFGINNVDSSDVTLVYFSSASNIQLSGYTATSGALYNNSFGHTSNNRIDFAYNDAQYVWQATDEQNIPGLVGSFTFVYESFNGDDEKFVEFAEWLKHRTEHEEILYRRGAYTYRLIDAETQAYGWVNIEDDRITVQQGEDNQGKILRVDETGNLVLADFAADAILITDALPEGEAISKTLLYFLKEDQYAEPEEGEEEQEPELLYKKGLYFYGTDWILLSKETEVGGIEIVETLPDTYEDNTIYKIDNNYKILNRYSAVGGNIVAVADGIEVHSLNADGEEVITLIGWSQILSSIDTYIGDYIVENENGLIYRYKHNNVEYLKLMDKELVEDGLYTHTSFGWSLIPQNVSINNTKISNGDFTSSDLHIIWDGSAEEYSNLPVDQTLLETIHIVKTEEEVEPVYVTEINDDEKLRYSKHHAPSNYAVYMLINELVNKISNLSGGVNPIGIFKAHNVDDIPEETLFTYMDQFVRYEMHRDPIVGDEVKLVNVTDDDEEQFRCIYLYNKNNQWIIWSENDTMPNATQEISGQVQYATEEQVKEGTSTDTVVTPKDVNDIIESIQLFYDE